MVFQAGVYIFRIIYEVRAFHSLHCPWWLAISIKTCGYFLSQVILFPEIHMLDYFKEKKSENCIDMKEKMLSNYSLHHMLFFKIYVDMGEFEVLTWLNPKKCCLENSPRVCTVSISHLVSRRAACISWPSSINLPRGQSRECGFKGDKDFFFSRIILD